MATQTQKDNFINIVAALVCAEVRKRGYGVPSVIIAQAIIESNWGLSGLAKYNNLFGLKCGSSWKGASVNMKTKEEYTVGTLTTIKDNFRAYANYAEGVAGYFDFISTIRYTSARTKVTPIEFVTALKNAGYATSSSYINTIMSCINTYSLTRFDTATNYTYTVDKFVIGNVYTTTVKLNVRTEPVIGKVLKTYPIGTRFTCKEVRNVNGVDWIRTPSGWLCTYAGGKWYVS